MGAQIFSTISLIIDPEDISIFSPLLQQGFKVPAKLGCSIKSMLCDQFGVTPAYLSQRIKTLFLNGKPVDDPESILITDNAVLALSAAMPGLVGATFRSGGALSIFRSSITHRNEKQRTCLPEKGMVTLKFFNLLISEMGPGFLENGIWVKNGLLKDLIEEQEGNQHLVFNSVIIDEREIRPDELRFLGWHNSPKLIRLKVQIKR
jgi:hypothetical protein